MWDFKNIKIIPLSKEAPIKLDFLRRKKCKHNYITGPIINITCISMAAEISSIKVIKFSGYKFVHQIIDRLLPAGVKSKTQRCLG